MNSSPKLQDLHNYEERLRRFRQQRRVDNLRQSVRGWLDFRSMIGGESKPSANDETKKEKDNAVQFDKPEENNKTNALFNETRHGLLSHNKRQNTSRSYINRNSNDKDDVERLLLSQDEVCDNFSDEDHCDKTKSIRNNSSANEIDFEDATNLCTGCRPRKVRWILFKFLIYLILQYIFFIFQFGAVFFIFACFYLILTNLNDRRRRKNDLSAYSVFNKDCQRLPGTVTAEQLQAGMMGAGLHIPSMII